MSCGMLFIVFLTKLSYFCFAKSLQEARINVNDRSSAVQACIAKYLERDLELLGLTGVEDKLQVKRLSV